MTMRLSSGSASPGSFTRYNTMVSDLISYPQPRPSVSNVRSGDLDLRSQCQFGMLARRTAVVSPEDHHRVYGLRLYVLDLPALIR